MAQRKRILVVDDIPLMRSMLAKYIERLAPKVFSSVGKGTGIEVLEAGNGQIAFDLLLNQSVDLIFLDLMMPEMDGLSFLSLKREEPTLADVPVIVCSAIGDAGTLNEAAALGAVATMKKPFTISAVEDSLRAVAPTF